MFGPCRRFACRDWRSCAAILIAASFFSSGRASAATITVTTTADSGAGSLRDAIGIAAAGDDIIVPAGTYGLTSGPLQITAGVSITGAGAATTIIDGGGIDGVFHISIPDVPTESVEISGLTVTNGALNGGIVIRQGLVMIADSIIEYNTSSFDGGGIYNDFRGHLTVVRTTIANNSASFEGGGIYNQGGETLILTDSTVAGNSATVGGGGIMNYAGGVAIIANSTISGNVAGEGGGVLAVGGAPVPSLTNVTITDNTATGSSGRTPPDGDFSSHAGGIEFFQNFYIFFGGVGPSGLSPSGVGFFKNTIIAGNHANTHADCQGPPGPHGDRPVISVSPGTFPSLGHNIIGDEQGCEGVFNAGVGDQVGYPPTLVDPMLGPLANNGGPTQTHALLAGSPALAPGGTVADSTISFVYDDLNGGIGSYTFDVSSTTACPPADQRGVPRPPGVCDVGSYELTNTPAGTNIVVQPVDAISGQAPVTLTFSDVSQPGVTTLTVGASGPPPPPGFKLGNPPTYFNLSTTVVYSGPIQICINYSGISFGSTSSLRLMHFESPSWLDVTTSLDTVNQIICGITNSLSPFAVFESGGDATPPVVTPQIAGTLGSNGWYTSDVHVSWLVIDPESAISSSSGCGPSSVTSDTAGISFTCTATSAGGTTSASVSVRRDATPPVLMATNQVVQQTMATGAVVTYQPLTIVETGSGLASSSCLPASGSTFPVGLTTVNCAATDLAGNTGSAAFTVTVNPALDGRIYGVGFINQGGLHHHFAFRVAQIRNQDSGRFEYWVNDPRRCGPDDDYDRDSTFNGDHDGDFGRDHRNPPNHFEATSINVIFSDDPRFQPSRGPRPTVDTVRFNGTGKWNGRSGYTFEVLATDQGEPGRHRDTFSLVIKDSHGTIVDSVSGALDGGNIQSTRLSR